MGSRILAVVDAWESMTTVRPWRPALATEQAVAEMRGESGRQFDPEVLEAFVKLLAEGDGDSRVAA
jgi:HD-GYP domain-containing protein (c-di-GMP phosphodiesterase class II)